MSLSPNTTLAHYTIVSRIGAGGMGEVYRARDMRLDREVAIKVLPAEVSSDADRLKRFEQEARATSALNHPNILTVYDVGSHESSPYIVVELLSGEELREQLDNGALPPRIAIDYAQQIAHGLSAAQEKGITHRDLKPENLFVTTDGRVKILDFGLAKLRPQRNKAISSEIATQKQITDAGTVMGTVGYMSPEQVRGENVDHRSDIFSFGSILYEMLSGQRAFRRDTSAETMTAILKEEPPELSLTNPAISPSLERIVRRCLEKQPARRFQTASDLAFALEAISTLSGPSLYATSAASHTETSPLSTGRLSKRERAAWITTAVFVLVSVGLLVFMLSSSRQSKAGPSPVVRYEVAAPPKTALNLIRWPSIALSQDGSTMVFAAMTDGISRLYVRQRDDPAIKLINGTDGASGATFSPDGKWIAFFANRNLMKTAIDGPVTSLLKVNDARGISWASDDSLIFTPDATEGLFQMSADGGQPRPVTKVDTSKKERTHRWPQVLPGGKVAIFTVGTVDTPDSYEKANIDAVNLATGERHLVLQGASMARYVSTGHLIFGRGGSLFAVGFDLETLSTYGKPQLILQRVAGDETTGVVHFTIADDGTLAYVPGSPSANMRKIAWVDRSGKVEAINLPPAQYNECRISPDGARAAVLVGSGGSGDVWVYDLARATSTRLTFNGRNATPVWSADGKSIYYVDIEPGSPSKSVVMRKLADGSRDAEGLISLGDTAYLKAITGDGNSAIFDYQRNLTNSSIIESKLVQGAELTQLVNTQFSEYGAALSYDGRWLAYQSIESGHPEIYVRDMIGDGGRWAISTEGGEEPRWSPDGSELYYRNGTQFMSVALRTDPAFQAGKPVNLFSGIFDLRTNSGITYDVDPKGNRFLMIRPAEDSTAPSVMIVLNWFDELRRIGPTK